MFSLNFLKFKEWLESKEPECIVGQAGKADACPIINYLKSKDSSYASIYDKVYKRDYTSHGEDYEYTVIKEDVDCFTYDLIKKIDDIPRLKHKVWYFDDKLSALECLEVVDSILETVTTI